MIISIYMITKWRIHQRIDYIYMIIITYNTFIIIATVKSTYCSLSFGCPCGMDDNFGDDVLNPYNIQEPMRRNHAHRNTGEVI